MSISPSHAEISELPPVSRPSASAFPAPADLQVDRSAWSALATTEIDALVIGESTAVLRTLTVIWPTLQKPVVWCESRRLTLPACWTRTLILEDVHALDAGDQQHLFDWLSDWAQSPRVIATASRPLARLVDSGLFSRRLYNRLKGVELIVT